MSTATSTPRFSKEVGATGLLALPLVLGHVSTGLISFVDNVIAGHHATATLAAVTIGTALLWLPMLIVAVLALVGVVLLARRAWKKRKDRRAAA